MLHGHTVCPDENSARREDGLGAEERDLMLAILEDAIRCYLGMVPSDRLNPKLLAQQAEYWIQIEDWDSPFSFCNVCESLGLERQSTRELILGSKTTEDPKTDRRRDDSLAGTAPVST